MIIISSSVSVPFTKIILNEIVIDNLQILNLIFNYQLNYVTQEKIALFMCPC